MNEHFGVDAAEIALLQIMLGWIEDFDPKECGRTEQEAKDLGEARKRIKNKLSDQIAFRLNQLRRD